MKYPIQTHMLWLRAGKEDAPFRFTIPIPDVNPHVVDRTVAPVVVVEAE